eukprot:jgi/Astpho2/7191/fgenesh1_pg.00113_%23_30_t
MDAVCRHLTAGCTTSWAHKVTALHRDGGGTWTLDVTDKAADSSQRMGGFNGIVLADYLAAKAGSPGTLNLEEVGLSHLQQQLRQTNPTPAFSLMVAVRGSLAASSFQAASISGHRLQWLSCDSSKPEAEVAQNFVPIWASFASRALPRGLSCNTSNFGVADVPGMLQHPWLSCSSSKSHQLQFLRLLF